MPTVVKDSRKRSPFWYACYTDATGRRLKKRTGQVRKAKAVEVCRALERAEALGRERALTEIKTREILSEVLERVTGEGLRVFTVRQWLEHFVRQKKKSRSGKTAARHEQMMNEFLAFLGRRADVNVAAITSKDISDFRDSRERQGLAPATINLDITILSSAFNAAQKQGHVSVNPCAALEPLPNTSERKDTFTPEQVTALVQTAEGDWRGLILTAFYVGARLGDCANLRWKNIDLLSSIPTIRYRPRKGAKADVVIAIHPVLADYLLSLPSTRDRRRVLVSVAGRSPHQSAVEIFPAPDGASTHRAAGDSRAPRRWPKRQRAEFSQPAPLVLVAAGERWRARGIANVADRSRRARRPRGLHPPRAGVAP